MEVGVLVRDVKNPDVCGLIQDGEGMLVILMSVDHFRIEGGCW